VWVISAFYALAAGWTLLSFVLVFSGAVQLESAEQTYFHSLNVVDWLLALAGSALDLIGAVFLFLLRRIAVKLFAVSLGLGVLSTAFQALRTNWLEVASGPTLCGSLLGWVIGIAIILYAHRLSKEGVLS
jgi:hypothetical protein